MLSKHHADARGCQNDRENDNNNYMCSFALAENEIVEFTSLQPTSGSDEVSHASSKVGMDRAPRRKRPRPSLVVHTPVTDPPDPDLAELHGFAVEFTNLQRTSGSDEVSHASSKGGDGSCTSQKTTEAWPRCSM